MIVFPHMLFASGVRPVWLGDFLLGTTSHTLPSGVSVSSPSLGGLVTDANGWKTYKGSNLLLNSATLSTQSVTLPGGATNYIISIKGTGSVTLSGAATGTLTGTGASNRVDLKFTGTAGGSLTVTVSGSVTSARLSAVTYETAFRSVDDFDTGASQYFGPAWDYDPVSVGTPLGLRYFPANQTNLLPYGGDFSGASAGVATGKWILAPGSSMLSSAMPDPSGRSTGATFALTNNTAVYQQFSGLTPGANYVFSAWIKSSASSGSPAIRITDNNTAAWNTGTSTKFTLTSQWVRYSAIVTSTTSSMNVGFDTRDATSANDASIIGNIDVWGAQLELGSTASPYIPTGASAVVASADTLSESAPLSTYLATKASKLQFKDYQTGVVSTSNFAAGAFAPPASPAWLQTLTVP